MDQHSEDDLFSLVYDDISGNLNHAGGILKPKVPKSRSTSLLGGPGSTLFTRISSPPMMEPSKTCSPRCMKI